MINFHEPRMFAAAKGRVGSLRWRGGVGALFAVGASFVLDNAASGFGWFLVLCMSMAFDAMLGNSYLESRGVKERQTSGFLFVWGTIFSLIIFAAMPLYLGYAGGGPGRVLAVLMAASSLVSVMMFLFQSPTFMAISALPATLVLLAMPFIPFHDAPATAMQVAVGVACGVAGFLAYVTRAALNNGKMVTGLTALNREAKARQLEAEVKRAEAEAANRAKTDFLTVMTHELRTPLNAVIGYAEIINEDLVAEGREALADDAVRITASARHLLGLIDQILNMTGVEAEGMAIREVDLRALIEASVQGADDAARTSGNRIAVRIAVEAERPLTDGNKLAVCVNALISNAVKFTTNGLVAVTAGCERSNGQDLLVVAVSDTGIGIAHENLQRVFQPFTQIEGANTRAKGGMGLGLAIAQRAARSLGGDISVTSEFGSGSTFSVRVPLKAEVAEAPAAVSAAA